MKIVLFGIQLSGKFILGNYIGVIKNFVKLQYDYQCYFMVVDFYVVIVVQELVVLCEQFEVVVVLFLVVGIDLIKLNVFL